MVAIEQKPVVEVGPAAPCWHGWRAFICGLSLGCLVPLAVACFWGPKSETSYEDPLTGRRKRESNWLGLALSNQVDEDEVSRWADRNSIPGTYPARYGWTVISRTQRGWFSPSWIACGGGFDIPKRIFHKEIAIDGLTREETLQRYQTELVAAYTEHHSTIAAQRKWGAIKE
jgi:hypothetical protein